MKTSRLPLLLLLISLPGCAMEKGDFPSLAPRPIESRGEDVAAIPPAPPAPADAALLASIAQLRGQVSAGEKAFSAALPGTTNAVGRARGAANGSEAWVTAQQMLSALESARSPTVTALAQLDSLYLQRIDAIAAGTAQGGADELNAVRQDAARAAEDQQARIDELAGRLNR